MTQRAKVEGVNHERVSQARLRAVPKDGGPGEQDEDPRPTIRIIAAEHGRMVREATAALSLDPSIYQRSVGSTNEMVVITYEPARAADEADGEPWALRRKGRRMTLQPGTPRVSPLTLASARTRLSDDARWLKFAKSEDGWVDTAPEPTVIASTLDSTSLGHWPDIRPIRGVRETPFIAPNGRIVSEPGYHAGTGFLLLPTVDVGDIPLKPTRENAQAALRYLWTECFCDFPYQGIGESKDSRDDDALSVRYEQARSCPAAFVAIAAMLSTLARQAINGAVMSYAFEANTQGAGKTKQAHVVSVVTTGRPAGAAAYPMTREEKTNDEEMSKVLGSYALAGIPICLFDNVKGEIGGGALEGAMTAIDTAPFRLLGTNELAVMPWAATIMFSGNNMTMTDDVSQRVLLSRLESEHENPRKRQPEEFRHPDLVAWVTENRPKLVRACLVILRAFIVAENPPVTKTVGSFEAWSELVPAAIAYAGGPDVTLATPEIDALSGESTAHGTLLDVWPESLKGGAKIADLIRYASFDQERKIERGEVAPDGLDRLRDALRELTDTGEGLVPTARKLGYALRSVRGKRRGLRWLYSSVGHDNVALWHVGQEKAKRAPETQPGLAVDTDPAEDFARE
jgi:hypothetical protein